MFATLFTRLFTITTRLTLALLSLLALQRDTFLTTTMQAQIGLAVDTRAFDFVTWEVENLWEKAKSANSGGVSAMTQPDRAAFVVDYLNQVAALQTLNGQIAAVYADPGIADPEVKTAASRTQRDSIAAVLVRDTPLAEHIVESQVATVLRDEGFALAGEVLPPVAARFQTLPQLIVISPRTNIEYQTSVVLNAAPVDQNAELEDQLLADHNVSALVVPIGGLGTYPALVLQTWNAAFLFETVAHEWSHNYLIFFPLGLNYDQPETRIINETVATLFGQVIGARTLRRYYANYPQLIAQLPPEVAPERTPAIAQTGTPSATRAPIQLSQPDEPTPFNAAAFMHRTRITTDFFLSLGLIDQAERYMEGQRRVFAAYGYAYRKINQAFFAFYGGYQGAGGNAAGGVDPTGALVRTVYEQAGASPRAFLEQVRGVITRTNLEDVAR